MSDTKLYILLIIGIWIGMLLGLSFLEAPLKFTAPNMTTKLGLGIGRIMFHVLNKAEIAFSLLLIILYTTSARNQFSTNSLFIYGVLATIVIVQSFWLLPVLDLRADRVLNNLPNPDSHLHLVYVCCEIVKLILLFLLFKLVFQHERY